MPKKLKMQLLKGVTQMCKHVKTENLYKCENEYLEELFKDVYPWQILPKIKTFLLEFSNKNIDGFFELKDGVFVGKNVTISPLATIEAPAIIGEGSEIRPGAYIRGNVIIGKKCFFMFRIKNG